MRCLTLLMTCVTLAPIVAGCAASAGGSELASRPKTLALSAEAGKVIRLPADGAFSIRHQQSSQVAELGGEATGQASLTESNAARASATVTAGGSASGVFQLGHAFRNESDQQVDLLVRVKLSYAYDASNEPREARPDASVSLNVFARDGRNRLIRSMPLVNHTTEQGDARSQGQEDVSFVATLGPAESLSVWVAGSARADVKPERSASASVQVSGVSIEVETRPAPPVRTASRGG